MKSKRKEDNERGREKGTSLLTIRGSDPTVLLLIALNVCLKFALIRGYHSTDFEVHRNWMAIAHHLPLSQWYSANISQWTLDYPPFFAYFEWVLARMAFVVDPAILSLQAEPFFSASTLFFQRISVIGTDFLFFFASVLSINSFVNLDAECGGEPKAKVASQFTSRLKFSLCALLICNPAIFLLDGLHFQYNSLLYGIFLLSLHFIFTNRFFLGALVFFVLLNFKHLYLYYAPGFLAFYLAVHLFPPISFQSFGRAIRLALALLLVLAVSFGPFLCTGGLSSLHQIMARLFPFRRGLTHANWAPNFWALYNSLDFVLYKIIVIFAGPNCSRLRGWAALFSFNCPPETPQYTRGLVQEYTHSVLPDISPSVSLALVLCALIPCFAVFLSHNKRQKWPFLQSVDLFLVSLSLSAYAFFWFGWHVHEKALLMVFFPFCLLAIKRPLFLQPFVLLFMASLLAQFPLFFTPLECLLKWAIALTSITFFCWLAHFLWALRPSELIRCPIARTITACALLVEMANLLSHQSIFGSSDSFLPLMLSSMACAALVCYSYLSLLITLFGSDFGLWVQKRKLLRKEKRIVNAERKLCDANLSTENIRFIGAVDLSPSERQPWFAVASLTVLSFPQMEVVFCADEVVLLTGLGGLMPYIPEYLALREGPALKRAILRHLPRCPPIDVLFVDGNGKWHSRVCGLACHVGFDTGLRTVGVSKNFTGFPLTARCERNELARVEEQITKECKAVHSEAVMSRLTWDGAKQDNDKARALGLGILRTKSSNTLFFVSAGFGCSFDRAMELAFACLGKHSPTVNPIRMSDLRSRERIAQLFDS